MEAEAWQWWPTPAPAAHTTEKSWMQVRASMQDVERRIKAREDEAFIVPNDDKLSIDTELLSKTELYEEPDEDDNINLSDEKKEEEAAVQTWLLSEIETAIDLLWHLQRQTLDNSLSSSSPSPSPSTVTAEMSLFAPIAANNSKSSQLWKHSTMSSVGIQRRLLLLDIIHANLKDNKTCTKRDVYYRDVGLFGDQRNVNRLLAEFAQRWHVPRDTLTIVASPKSHFAGQVLLTARDGAQYDGLHQPHLGTLIPPASLQLSVQTSATRVLFIEKYAAFHQCLHSFSDEDWASTIIVTSRGYADQACVRFLQLLGETVPIYALCDADPDGVQIYWTLKYGSAQTADLPDDGQVRALRWLPWSLLPSPDLNVKHAESCATSSVAKEVPLNDHDVSLAFRLLQKVTSKPDETYIRRLLQHVLHDRVKRELQATFSSSLASLEEEEEEQDQTFFSSRPQGSPSMRQTCFAALDLL